MAEEIERLLVRIEANAEHFEKSLKKMNGELRKAQKGTNDALKRIETDTRRQSARMFSPMGDALRREVPGFAAIMAGAFSARQILDYADSYTSLQNRLKAAGLEGERLKQVEESLYDIANRNGVQVEATTQLYQRAVMARANLGATEEQLMNFVSGTTAALRLQGSSATEASGSLLQLGQLLGCTKVQAGEFNSLVDGLPTILQAVANGSDRWAGSTTKLTKDVKDGKVSAQEFFAAALKGFGEIEQKAGSATMTVGGALTVLNNQLGRYIGQADGSLSATSRMAEGIKALADNLDTIVPVVLTLAGIIGTRYFVALTASASAQAVAAVSTARLTAFQIAMTASMTGATRAQVALNMAMAANPIGLVVTVVAALAGGLYLLANRYNLAAVAQRRMTSLKDAAERAMSDYEQAVLDAAAATGEERKRLLETASALREVQQERLNDMRIEAQRQRVEAESARQLAARRREEAKETRARVGNNAGSNAGSALVGGANALAAGQERLATDAEKRAEEAEKSVKDIENAIKRADNARTTGAGGGGGGGDEEKKKGKKGRDDAERQREMRAELALQLEIDKARASGDEAAIKAAERKKDLADMTARYEAAGYANAVELAATHQSYVDAAEDDVEAKKKAAEAAQKLQQIFEEIATKQKEEAELQRDRTLDQLGYQAELARAQGDETAIKNAERRLFIEQRTLEILRLKLATTEAEARAMAGGEYDTLDHAEEARNSAQTIVSVLRSDNIWEEAGRRFKDAAWDGFEDLLSQLLGSINEGNGGKGLWGGVFSWLGGKGFSSGGYTGAGGVNQPAGVVHAGEIVWSQRDIARAGGVSVVEAMRKGVTGYSAGGIVQAPKLPSVNSTVSQLRSQQTVGTHPLVIQLAIDEGGLFVPRVQTISGNVAVQTTTMGVATVQDQQRASSMRRRQSLV